MLMLSPNKSRVTTIIASIKRKKGMPGERESQMEGPDQYEEQRGVPSDSAAAKEATMDSFIIAMEKKNSRAMARALEQFLELCHESYESDQERDEEGESSNRDSSYDEYR